MTKGVETLGQDFLERRERGIQSIPHSFPREVHPMPSSLFNFLCPSLRVLPLQERAARGDCGDVVVSSSTKGPDNRTAPR